MALIRRSPIGVVFLTVSLDMLGVGIVIPVLPALFVDPQTSILPASTSDAARSVMYGYLVAAYPIMQFFGAPILGALSDRYGRKPMLQISLVGTLAGYLLLGWAVYTANVWLLFVSRLIPGFTGGNISIIMSALSDIATPVNRTKYFGLVGMAFGIGFILGPAIGGILADSSISPLFGHATPFWFTAALTVVNLLYVQTRFDETIAERRLTPVSFFSGARNIKRAFSLPHLHGIFAVSLLLSLGFSFFTQFFSVFMIQKFGFQERDIGMLFAWVGLWLVFTQGVVVRRLAGRIAPRQILRWSVLFQGIALAAVLLPRTGAQMYFVNPFIALFQGLTSPNLTTVISSSARPQEQGEILGINQSMISVGQALPPIIAGYLNSINGAYPMIAASLLTFGAWIAFRIADARHAY